MRGRKRKIPSDFEPEPWTTSGSDTGHHEARPGQPLPQYQGGARQQQQQLPEQPLPQYEGGPESPEQDSVRLLHQRGAVHLDPQQQGGEHLQHHHPHQQQQGPPVADDIHQAEPWQRRYEAHVRRWLVDEPERHDSDSDSVWEVESEPYDINSNLSSSSDESVLLGNKYIYL